MMVIEGIKVINRKHRGGCDANSQTMCRSIYLLQSFVSSNLISMKELQKDKLDLKACFSMCKLIGFVELC